MFKLTLAAIFSLFFFSAIVSGSVLVPRKDPPAGWWFAGLENYTVYHTRYLAIGCQLKHNTTFFADCCHPLLKDQTLEKDRPPQCKPSAEASSSAAAAEPTSTVSTPYDDDGDDADCSDSVVTVTSTSTDSSATPTESASDDDDDDDCDDDDGDDDDDDDDDGDDEDCDDGDDDDEPTSTSHAPSSTPVPVNVEPAPTSDPITSTHSSAPVTTSSPVHTSTSTTTHPTSTHTSTTEAAPTSTHTSSGSGGSGSQTFSGGVATFFTQNGNAGACGKVHADSDFIAAIDSARYGPSDQTSSLCGKSVTITNTKNGKTVTVTIQDDCPTCINANSIDLSVGAFTQIATEEEGEVPIVWHFN